MNLPAHDIFTLPPSPFGTSQLDHSASNAGMDRKEIPGLAQLLDYLDTADVGDKQLTISHGEPRRVRELASWLISHHYVTPHRAKGTCRNAKDVWSRIRKMLGDMWLHELDLTAVRRLVRRDVPGLNAATIKYLRAGLRMASSMGWAVPPRDPTAGLRTTHTVKRAVGATEEIVRDILAAAKEWEAEAPGKRWRHAGVVRLIALTGCRVNEVCTLRWDAIDLVTRRIRLTSAKAGPRTVPLSRMAINELLLLPSRGKSEWVFPSPSCMGPIHPPRAWYEIRKLAGHENLRRHDLRHGFATIAAEQVRLECVQQALGHKNLKQTQHYTGDQLKLGHEASEAVAKRLKGAM